MNKREDESKLIIAWGGSHTQKPPELRQMPALLVAEAVAELAAELKATAPAAEPDAAEPDAAGNGEQ